MNYPRAQNQFIKYLNVIIFKYCLWPKNHFKVTFVTEDK